MSAVIVNLSDNFRLSAGTNAILLEERSKDGWVLRFQYASLGDALQGYVRYTIAKLGQMSITANVLDLLDAVQKLEKTVAKAYNDLIKYAMCVDPVERACLQSTEPADGTE